jgi:hypothetical protein
MPVSPRSKPASAPGSAFYNQHQSLGYRTPRQAYKAECPWICGRSASPTSCAFAGQRFYRPKKLLDELSGFTGWRLHDLRRAAPSGFSALPFPDEVREAVLDHKPRGIRRVYDLHKFRDEKLELLTAWEERLLAIVESGAAKNRSAAA